MEVKELVPPYVRTHLMGQRQSSDQGPEKYRELFQQMNDRLFAAHKGEW